MKLPRTDVVSRPAFLLVAGRTVGFVMAFAIPVVLARLFGRAEFGTYKQLFLIYGTLFGLAQVGMAESLYYFVPGKPELAGRRVANAVATLALIGAACVGLLYATRGAIADWLTNPDLAGYLPLIALFLAFTLVSAVFEIVMVSRKEHLKAAAVYAGSDLVRTALIVGPAIALWGLRGVLIGAAAFAGLRLAAMFVYLWREFGRDLRLDLSLWRGQLGYALPFALAVGIEVIQANLHQYLVASRFDAATFAIYAVGCLQIPLIDMICTSTGNVMMVRMAEEAADVRDKQRQSRMLALWHDTTTRLATIVFPLTALLLLTAPAIIVTLFTASYAASVPIFMIWCLTIVPAAFQVDAMLRAHAQTRFLLIMNVARLVMIAALIGWFLSAFGMAGAVLITLLGICVVKAAGVVKIARLLNVSVAEVLPWGRLAAVASWAALSAVPAFWISRSTVWPPLAVAAATGAVYTATLGAIWYASSLWTRVNPQQEIPPCVASQAS